MLRNALPAEKPAALGTAGHRFAKLVMATALVGQVLHRIFNGIAYSFGHWDFAKLYTFTLPLAEPTEITEYFDFSLSTHALRAVGSGFYEPEAGA